MTAVLELLAVVLARVGAITGLVQLLTATVQTISNYLNPTTGISQITAIQNTVISINGDVENVTYGLSAIKGELDALQASVTALGSPQQAGDPVTLPTVPPTGYSGPDAETIWAYTASGGSKTMREWLTLAGVFALNVSGDNQIRWASTGAPGYSVSTDWSYDNQPPIDVNTGPTVDPDTILATDTTYLGWLDRVYTAGTFAIDGAGYAYIDQAGSSWRFTLLFDEPAFWEWKATKFAAAAAAGLVPPVWPGAANVTLGTPVAIESTNVITALMHGVLIEIDTVPVGRQTYIFDSYTSYGHIGQVAFQQDSGWSELPQNLGFDNAVYSPKEMREANHVRWRIFPGVTGFVTPWTINP